MGPDLIGVLAALAYGLVIGSFLNVCIHRLPSNQSLLRPRSRCPSCGAPVRWYDNIPALSYVVLRGRCRSCQAPISVQYPLVEITTAALFLLAYRRDGLSWALLSDLLLLSALVVLGLIDLHHRILPNRITYSGTIAGVLLGALVPGRSVAEALIGAGAGFLALFLFAEIYLRWRGVEGMGMGDAKMMAMLGAFLGWKGAALALLIGSLAGSAVGIGLLLARRGNLQSALPFGTFLALGGVVASLWGDGIIRWYWTGF
ncbi:MAG TPA: A24 family peptidase [Acidobacteriota bacterium]